MTDDLGAGDKFTAEAEARTAAPGPAAVSALHDGPNPRFFYLVGGGLVALALGSLAWLYLVGLGGAPLTKLLPVLKGDFSYIAIPGVLLLLAGVALFFGEMFRRGELSERERTFLQGGSVGLQLAPTRLRIALLWMLVPVVVYLALVLPAILGETGGGDWARRVQGASADFWTLVAFYSFVAAGTVGVFLASLLKRATYRALARRGRVREGGNTFWRLVATQWRLETWFAFTATGLLGALPFLWHDALAGDKPFDGSALAIMGGISAASAVIAAVIVLNAWRSGDPYGFGESVA